MGGVLRTAEMTDPMAGCPYFPFTGGMLPATLAPGFLIATILGLSNATDAFRGRTRLGAL